VFFQNNLVQICTSVYIHTALRATRLGFVFKVDMLRVESTYTSDILCWLILILDRFCDLFTEILQRAVMYFEGRLYRFLVGYFKKYRLFSCLIIHQRAICF